MESDALTPVYPRVCGGTFPIIWPMIMLLGLSPRVRGNRSALACVSLSDGSIPACAGEPYCRTPRAASSEVYPRVCGGTIRRIAVSMIGKGLSPRVRGNL